MPLPGLMPGWLEEPLDEAWNGDRLGLPAHILLEPACFEPLGGGTECSQDYVVLMVVTESVMTLDFLLLSQGSGCVTSFCTVVTVATLEEGEMPRRIVGTV